MSPDRSGSTARPSAARIVAGDLESARERALAQLERAAFERGVAEGERRERVRAAGALDRAAEALEKSRGESAQLAVEIALDIARVLLRRDTAAGNYDLVGMVREALSFSGVGRGRCVVHVHPEDAKSLESVSFRAGTVIEPDVGVARGDVQISTPQGLLVREFEQSLSAIADRLREEVS